jgi:hypothetical protein
MAKKKKKKEVSDFLWFANYSPGLVPTHFTSFPQGGKWQYSYSITRPGPDMGYIDSMAKGATEAFWEYTFGGPVAQMAGKSAAQAGLLTASGVYASFRLGLAIEMGVDFAALGAVLTVTDPANKWEGGLDEWGLFGGNDTSTMTVSTEGHNPFVWGLQQGPLAPLFNSVLGI